MLQPIAGTIPGGADFAEAVKWRFLQTQNWFHGSKMEHAIPGGWYKWTHKNFQFNARINSIPINRQKDNRPYGCENLPPAGENLVKMDDDKLNDLVWATGQQHGVMTTHYPSHLWFGHPSDDGGTPRWFWGKIYIQYQTLAQKNRFDGSMGQGQWGGTDVNYFRIDKEECWTDGWDEKYPDL